LKEARIIDDFELYIDNEPVILDSVVLLGQTGSYTLSRFYFVFTEPSITVGQKYKIKVVYTPDPNREINKDGKSYGEPLEGFEKEGDFTAEEL
jgi:hypothetical protein